MLNRWRTAKRCCAQLLYELSSLLIRGVRLFHLGRNFDMESEIDGVT